MTLEITAFIPIIEPVAIWDPFNTDAFLPIQIFSPKITGDVFGLIISERPEGNWLIIFTFLSSGSYEWTFVSKIETL